MPGTLICCSMRLLRPFTVITPFPLTVEGPPPGSPSILLRFIVILVSMTPSKASA